MLPQLSLVWADKPGCNFPAAEIWIDNSQLWVTLFIDDRDRILKIEFMQKISNQEVCNISLSDVEKMIELAKHDLLTMVDS